MSATTVKLESDLLDRIAKVKAADQTLASFVREAVENDLRRRQLREAAEAYQKLMIKNKAEQQEMQEWQMADLARQPKRKKQ